MSADNPVAIPAEPALDAGASPFSGDGLLDALNAEKEARARAEERYRERDRAVARLEDEIRDLIQLRDNFHSLYREERELRAEADRVAAERIQERDTLQQEIVVLGAEVDRLQRTVAKLKTAEPAPAPASATAPAAELSAATERIAELEREVAMARSQLAGSQVTASAATSAELTAAMRRVHDLDGQLAALRAEHADLRAAHDRAAATCETLQQALRAEQAKNDEGGRFVASAEQRVREAVVREQEAVRAAHDARAAAERFEHELQAARATIAVLEKRIVEAEAARAAAEKRVATLSDELSVVRSEVLANRGEATGRRSLLRRRGAAPVTPEPGHVEAIGTAVGGGATVEVTGTAEDVESALHRRLFGE